jgi:voltage-gated potassium channel
MRSTVRGPIQALFFMSAIVFSGGLGLFLLGKGRWTMGETLYMALISASTVGYSELPHLEQVPHGRLFISLVIITGVGTFAYFQSTLTAVIVENVIGKAFRRSTMKRKIQNLRNHVVLAGIGATGRHVVEELVSTNTPFVVIDRQLEGLERVSVELCKGNLLFVHGDATEDSTLIAAGIEHASGVIAALTHDKDNLFVTLSSRSLNSHARIVTKVVEHEAIPKMKKAGANATVSPNIIGGQRLASELIRPEVTEFLDQMLRDKDKNLRLEEVFIASESRFVGMTLRDVNIRKTTSALVVAIRDTHRNFHYNPNSDYVLEGNSYMVVLGQTPDIAALKRMFAESASSSGKEPYREHKA